MKRITSILLLSVASLAIGSCQKVIDLKIDDSEQKVVIEAELAEGSNSFNVLVSHSTLYNSLSSSSPIENATVVLTDDQGLSIPIPNAGNGVYSELINAMVGRTYTLSVQVDGTTYVASSTMKDDIQLDDLPTTYISDPAFGGDPGTRVKYLFTDPANISNFYRIRYSLNGIVQNDASDLLYVNDNLNDGQQVSRVVTRKLFQSGQTIDVEFIHIDEATYDYLYTLGDIIGSSYSASAAPSNPVTNWSNGAIGVFSAYNIDSMSVVIP